MTAIFALVVCIVLGAPWWAYVIGGFCLILDNN